jgi:hypothetical protein
MFCWVRPHEKKELKEAVNKQFPLIFAKNYEDFIKQIQEDDYLVFSLSRARNINKIRKLVRTFPKFRFNLYALGEEVMNTCHFKIMTEENVTKGQYPADCFVPNYLGNIIDLWDWKLNTDTRDYSHLLTEDAEKLII